MPSSNAGVQTVSAELPAMPLTLEGLSVLHQMFRFRWPEWRKLDAIAPGRTLRAKPPRCLPPAKKLDRARCTPCWGTRAI